LAIPSLAHSPTMLPVDATQTTDNIEFVRLAQVVNGLAKTVAEIAGN